MRGAAPRAVRRRRPRAGVGEPMSIDRRTFLSGASALAVGGAIAGVAGHRHLRAQAAQAEGAAEASAPEVERDPEWAEVRAAFELEPDVVHLAGLLVAAHPAPVRAAIERHRAGIDENPARYVVGNNTRLKAEARAAAARYTGTRPEEIALTDSTTMGTALAITGLRIRDDQEMLTATLDYYSTHEAMAILAERTGASVREVPLYADIRASTPDEIIEALVGEIRPHTRLVTATWVHSATGLLVPVRAIADRIAELNEGRSDEDRIVFFVDGVHGLGVEDTDLPELGCDLFSAGTHKWMLAPRGTGILWGHPRVHAQVRPSIPTFTRDAGWGGRMSPGGFKPFEHEWAMAEAFEFHRMLGRPRVQARIHELTNQLKEELDAMPHVTLQSPRRHDLTAGIVCFDVDGLSSTAAVRALRDRGVIASRTPYARSHARLTPSIYNDEADLEAALRAVRDLG
jgi:isopenicillin-N epimerase